MPPLEAITLAVLGGGAILSNHIFYSPKSHSPPSYLTSDYYTSIRSSEAYDVPRSVIDTSAISFAQEEVLVDVREIPTVTVTLSEQQIPNRTADYPMIEEDTTIVFNTIRDVPSHLNTLASHLFFRSGSSTATHHLLHHFHASLPRLGLFCWFGSQ
jgi:hypothetical protein